MLRSVKIAKHSRRVAKLREAIRKIDSTIPFCYDGAVKPLLKNKRKKLEFLLEHETMCLTLFGYELEAEIRALSDEIVNVNGYDWAYLLIDIDNLERQLNYLKEGLCYPK